MDELQAILDEWRNGEVAGNGVLATVVHVKGSAYRRPGARMLILPGGRRIGSVSGGCLEGEVTRKAWWHTESGEPSLRVYDTSSSDEAVWEFGLGCNGIVQVLLERMSHPSVRQTLTFLEEQRRNGRASVVATVIRREPGADVEVGDRLLFDGTAIRGGRLAGTSIEAAVAAQALHAAIDARSRLAHIDGCEIFVEYSGLPLSLVIFGGGHDVMPLAAVARQMGWRATVADARAAYARPDRFPGAERVVLIHPDRVQEQVRITPATAVVMMTHNYPLDERLLPEILAAQPFYLGMLGPRNRAERLFETLGQSIPSFVHAPIGLDLGGDSAASIAVSITAEIQAVIEGRQGGCLKFRHGAIHRAPSETGTPRNVNLEGERPSFCETVLEAHV